MGPKGKKNKGRYDGNQESNPLPKRPKTHEEQLKREEVFDGSMFSNIKKLNELMTEDFSKKEFVLNLKEKIYRVMHRGQKKDFKANSTKNMSFFEWVTQGEVVKQQELNERRMTQAEVKQQEFNDKLNVLKNGTCLAGIFLFGAILDFLFLISQKKSKEMEAKFQVFEDVLTWVKEDEVTVVIFRVLKFIRAIKETLKTNRVEETKGKEVKAEESQSIVDDILKESFLDDFMYTFLGEIFKFELFWVSKRLPCNSDSLIEVIPSLQNELRDREEQVLEMPKEINEARKKGGFGEVNKNLESIKGYSDMKQLRNKSWENLGGN